MIIVLGFGQQEGGPVVKIVVGYLPAKVTPSMAKVDAVRYFTYGLKPSHLGRHEQVGLLRDNPEES